MTGDDIAAWFAHQRFWVALRSVEPGQPTHIWSSHDGRAWRRHGDLAPSILGPTVQNNFETDEARVVLVNE
jgi:hypothetical protein